MNRSHLTDVLKSYIAHSKSHDVGTVNAPTYIQALISSTLVLLLEKSSKQDHLYYDIMNLALWYGANATSNHAKRAGWTCVHIDEIKRALTYTQDLESSHADATTIATIDELLSYFPTLRE